MTVQMRDVEVTLQFATEADAVELREMFEAICTSRNAKAWLQFVISPNDKEYVKDIRYV